MKKTFLLISILSLLIGCTHKQIGYEDEIKNFQYELNTQFADAEESPLTEEDLKSFKTLDFFPIDKKYNITAKFTRTPNEPVFEMPTTTDRLPLYKKYGVAYFTLNGKKIELNIYQNQQLMTSIGYENHLFLPFNDATNGKSTYGGGRYIDLEIPEKDTTMIRIDFNRTYNPYCAYNHKYSCPIPPKENTIPIEILAGVKAYNKH
ncbi:DUF1684 domain-containing protein [Lutibacter aestuarii]|uniref:DUF1684 domain-containing protein n=1 Tax=Lutibacter aestuarii TaxID=861111 RepID=A0ABW2Z3Q0_9FLAO|nr:DUF1684 domain-containing protein [uncultured Lutibacter sp.]